MLAALVSIAAACTSDDATSKPEGASGEAGDSGASSDAGSGGKGGSNGTGLAGNDGAGAEAGTDPNSEATGELTPEVLSATCAITFPDAWLTRDGEHLVTICGHETLSLVSFDTGEETTVATLRGGPPLAVALDEQSVIYLDVDEQRLNRASLAGGAEPTVLALDAHHLPFPQFAAGGARVVYVSDSTTGYANVLLSSPIEGGTPALLVTEELAISNFQVAPDGLRVFTISPEFQLFSVAVEGGEPLEMGPIRVDSTVSASPIAFSPDNKQVAFVMTGDLSNDPQTLALGALDEVPERIGGAFYMHGPKAMVFTPDGSNVLVHWSSQQVSPPKEFIDSVPTGGGAAVTLATADTLQLDGPVGTAGTAVLIQAKTGGVSPELLIVDAGGGEAQVLSSLDECALHNRPNKHISISADRTRAVYPDVLGHLVLADLDARTVVTLVPNSIQEHCSDPRPLWSPDGTKIAYRHCSAVNKCDLRVISATGEPLATISSDGEYSRAYFSPDSRRVIGTEDTGGNVFTFTSRGITQASFTQDIPFSIEHRFAFPPPKDFDPPTFPWVDSTRFIVQPQGGAAQLIDTAP